MKLEWRAWLLDKAMILFGIKLSHPDAGSLEKLRFSRGYVMWFINWLGGKKEALARVEDLSIPTRAGEIYGRLYSPEKSRELPIVVYFHGGGWVSGNLDSHDRVCRRVAKRLNRTVLAVDYRLAPEHRFPAAAEDAFDALCWAANNAGTLRVDVRDISVMGDSAGGNLAAVSALLSRDNNGPRIRRQILIYPFIDASRAFDSCETYRHAPVLTSVGMDWMLENYIGDEANRNDVMLSPAQADLSNLPPAFIACAEYDPLADHSKWYQERLQAAGGVVELEVYARQIHGFFSLPRVASEVEKSLVDIEKFFQRH